MPLVRDKEKRCVQLNTVLRLVQRDGYIELEPRLGFFKAGVKLRVSLGVQPVGGLQQFKAQVFGVIRFSLCRREPIPKLALRRL